MFEELPEGQTNFDPVAEAKARQDELDKMSMIRDKGIDMGEAYANFKDAKVEDGRIQVKAPKESQYEWWNCYSPEQLEKRDQAIRQEVATEILAEIDNFEEGKGVLSLNWLRMKIGAKFNIKKGG